MLKMTIDGEEVVSKNNFTIKEEMLSPSSTILNNTYPKTWEDDKDYTSRFYYPKDYAKLNIQNFSITPEEAGTTIQINGSATLTDVDTTKESRVLRLLGQTSQTGTPTPSSPIPVNVVSGDNEINICGKNLFDISTITENKYYDTSGNFNSANTYDTSDFIVVNSSSTYTFNTKYTTSGYMVIAISEFDKDKTFIVRNSTQAYKYTFTTGANTKYIRISYRKDATAYDLQLEKGSTATTYEPYIGNTYPIYLGVENRWKSSDALQGPYNANAYLTNTRIAWYGREVSSGETITVKCNNSNLQFTLGRTTMNANNSSNVESQDTGWKTGEFTLTYNGSGYAFVGISKTDNSSVSVSSLTDDDFEISYNGNYISTTPIELCKIGTYQDYIYKDNGSWYLHKEIGKVVLDGSESWEYDGNNTRFRVRNILDSQQIASTRLEIISNYFRYANSGNSNGIGFAFWQDNATTLYLYNYDYNTTADFETWLGTHNTIVYYVLDTPTTTEITDTTLLEQLDSLQSD